MPIHGLTYDERSDGRLPRLGVLRKGAPKPNDRQPGRDLGERLRFAGIDEDVQADWVETFGAATVDEVDIVLPYDRVDDCWEAWREAYVAGGLKVRCDGQNHVLWQRPDGTYSTDPVPCPGESCDAKPVGRLEVMVPRLARLGTITVTTTSKHDLIALDGSLRALAIRFGSLRGMPLRLTRAQRMISKRGEDGRRSRVPTWLLHLEPSPDWVRDMYDRLARTTGPFALEGGARPALEAPEDVDAETGEIIDGAAVTSDQDVDDALGRGWTERIEACRTTHELDAVIAAAGAIEVDRYRQNVLRLAYRRTAALVAGALDRIDPSKPAAAEKVLSAAAIKLDPLPMDLPEVSAALDKLEDARQRVAGTRGKEAA